MLVGLLHGAVVLSLWKQPVWADRVAAVLDRPPLVVTLWQQVRQVTRTAKPPTAPARQEPLLRPRAPEPQAITLPSLPSLPPLSSQPAPPAPTNASAPPAAEPTADTPAPRLNLALPRGASAPWRQRSPALDDPRSNSAKLTMEQKLANAMGGDGTWVEERVDLDHVRLRRGDQCVLMTRTRAGQLELANGAFRNSWTVREC